MTDYLVSVHPTGSGSGSFSYTSLSSAVFNAVSDTGATAGDTITCEIQGTWASADTTAAGLGNTLGPDKFYVIADASNYFDGDYDATKYRLIVSGTALIGGEANLEIHGLQAISTGNVAFQASTSGPVLLESSYIESQFSVGLRLSSTGQVRARNSMFKGATFGVQSQGSSTVFVGHNCVARDCGTTGFQRNSGSHTVRNCISTGSGTTDFNGTMTREYCASEDATATGTGCIASATFTFTTSTSGLLDASDTSGAIGGGTDLSAHGTLPVVTDVLGATYLNPPSMGINEAGASGGTDALSTQDLTGAAPLLDSPAIGQVHALATADLTGSAPLLDAPAIGQSHALETADLTGSAPVLDSPSFGQAHALASADLTGSAPALDAPALGQLHALQTADLALSAPSLDATALGQVHALSTQDLTGSPPLLDSPTLGTDGTHALATQDLTGAAPVLDSPTLGQIHALGASDLAGSAPVLDAPALGQVHGINSLDLAGSPPVLDSPSLGQVHALSTADLTGSAPVLDSPALGVSSHALTGLDLFGGAPLLDSPALGQIHALATQDLIGGAPILGTPYMGALHALAIASRVLTVTAESRVLVVDALPSRVLVVE